MADTINNMSTILIGACGVIIGAFVTQVFSIINNYYSDKRKYNSEQRQALLIRKITVGEEFYALNGLAIQSFKKTLHYLETKDTLKTKESIEFLEKGLNEKGVYLKSITEREKAHTAINLYYKIQSNFETSQDFENNYIGLVARIKDINAESTEALELYFKLNDELINLLKVNISIIESDRKIIETEVKRIMNQFFD